MTESDLIFQDHTGYCVKSRLQGELCRNRTGERCVEIFQARNNGAIEQDGVKGSNYGYILKVEPTGFTHRFLLAWREKETDDRQTERQRKMTSKWFGLSNWKIN